MKITEKQFQKLWDIFVSNLTSQQESDLYSYNDQLAFYKDLINQQSNDTIETIEKSKMKFIQEEH